MDSVTSRCGFDDGTSQRAYRSGQLAVPIRATRGHENHDSPSRKPRLAAVRRPRVRRPRAGPRVRRPRVRRPRVRRPRVRRPRVRRPSGGEVGGHREAAAGDRLGGDRPTVRRDDGTDDGQPQARTAPAVRSTRPRRNGSNSSPTCSGGTTAPLDATRSMTEPAGRGPVAMLDPAADEVVPHGVLHQVADDAFEQAPDRPGSGPGRRARRPAAPVRRPGGRRRPARAARTPRGRRVRRRPAGCPRCGR